MERIQSIDTFPNHFPQFFFPTCVFVCMFSFRSFGGTSLGNKSFSSTVLSVGGPIKVHPCCTRSNAAYTLFYSSEEGTCNKFNLKVDDCIIEVCHAPCSFSMSKG